MRHALNRFFETDNPARYTGSTSVRFSATTRRQGMSLCQRPLLGYISSSPDIKAKFHVALRAGLGVDECILLIRLLRPPSTFLLTCPRVASLLVLLSPVSLDKVLAGSSIGVLLCLVRFCAVFPGDRVVVIVRLCVLVNVCPPGLGVFMTK